MTTTTSEAPPDSIADPDGAPEQGPRARYHRAAERHGAAVAELEVASRRVEMVRLVTFLVGAVLGLLYDDLPVPPVFPVTGAVVFLGAFLLLVVRHRRLRRRLRRERAAETLARAGLLRLRRDWAGLHAALDEFGYRDPLLEPETSDETHPYAQDLDLFGPTSVRALLGPTPTATGTQTLRRWLEAPGPVEEVRRRQAAVRSLAADPEGRDALAIEGLLVDRVHRSEWTAFLGWLERPPLLAGEAWGSGDSATLPRWVAWSARGLPPLTFALFVGWAFGLAPWWGWLPTFAVQFVVAWRWGGLLGSYLKDAGARSPGLRRHHPLFAAWEAYETGEPAIHRARAALTGPSGLRASEEVRALGRYLDAAESRSSMIHGIFRAFFLWDVHVVLGLEAWRRRTRGEVTGWFEALGELEALSALATLAHDQPDWSFPEFHASPPGLRAEALGHPLLSDAERKTSDVTVAPLGRFLLVTGSNMSGKSTLLRSIGLAAVLGQAGSVVCARRAEMSPLRTFTSMRIHDSLTAGVSLFMAELLRLKALVDAADASGEQPALLYLIDEVLQGTNSEERRVAARRIITHLLDAHAVGAVTTHDLALHEDPRLDRASAKVHFRETVEARGEEVLTFDYKLRPGLATSRNALKLLRIVGLDDENAS